MQTRNIIIHNVEDEMNAIWEINFKLCFQLLAFLYISFYSAFQTQKHLL